ncbi:hypothetical protein [Nannocystis punicea]|uniref:Uncharacterized protein n=1 Tax=Nannocystis punicea TaxID=2995304 RepID=A0ABY7H8R3_9BACT|nr:hypothetical protein [Nannocystis poenicansa]WAS95661.1 hypothetical protein O0S08_05820 [Nannocystis poenicansa]
MNEMVKRVWTGLDGRLVFDFTISRDPSDGLPSTARVSCAQTPWDERLVTIPEARVERIDLGFRSGCRVRGTLEQRAHIHIDGVENTGIFADIYFGLDYEQHFEGLMVACPSRKGPAPWIPPPPTPGSEAPTAAGSPLPVISAQPNSLFTYVYVRRWPRVPEDDQRYGFIEYFASSPPSSSFYEDLGAAREQGRAAAEDLAVKFIDGDSPYEGQFIGDVRDLAGPIGDFAALAGRVQRSPDVSMERLLEEIEALLERHGEPAIYFSGADYRAKLDRIWQSYFALVVTLGYDWALLNDLAQSLWLGHIIGLVMTTTRESTVPELEPSQLAELLDARVLLPVSIFPLPPATTRPGAPAPAVAAGWIEPYAIGDLQMVRHRLLRYMPGEIARIENVMRGERRESSRRHMTRRVDVQKNQGSEEQFLQNDDSDERSSLLEETRRLVAEKSVADNYSNFNTSYGPPTLATLNGSKNRTTTQGPNPGVDDVTRFARETLNKSVNRIRRKIEVARTTSTTDQVEDVVTSVIDNTGGEMNMCAVFRWLNKVYQASVINYGNRLMMEFMISRPAARHIAQAAALTGHALARPVPPAALGILSFKDIDPDNYAQTGAVYGVTELEPPPLAHKYVTATLRAGEVQQIAVPTGYCATNAFVDCVSTPAGLPPPVVLVGRQAFNAGSASAALRPYGEDSTIPVSVMGLEAGLSPPSEAQVLVNVEVECEPTIRTTDEWRIGVYRSLLKAHQQRLAEYYAELGAGGQTPSARSSLANRQIERGELMQACTHLLLERMARLTGACDPGAVSSPPSPSIVDEPRYLQFLDEALEWSEMAYSFHVSPRARLLQDPAGAETAERNDDPLFTSFLQAERARVLLPVRPAHVTSFLYAFSSGGLWGGMERLVPVLAGDLALVNDLERTVHAERSEREVGRSWEIVVPTSMQILDESLVAGPNVPVSTPEDA